MIRIREGSVYQQMRRSGHTKRKMKVNHILLWMNQSHYKQQRKKMEIVILMTGLQDSVYKMSQMRRQENNLTMSVMFIAIYMLIINLL